MHAGLTACVHKRTMKHLIQLLCLVCFCCIGCSSTMQAGEPPLWLENPTSVVKKDDIYAIGNGATLAQAQQHARSEILKYFETNISSEFTGNLTATDATMTHQIDEQVQERTSGLVQGVSMVRSYKAKDGYYVLSVLDKTKAQKILRQEIEILDAQLKHLLVDSPDNTFLFSQRYQEREKLNQKYLLLTGMTLALDVPTDKIPHTLQGMTREKKEKRTNMGKVSVAVLPSNPDLQIALESHLAELGYILNARGKTVVLELKKQDCQPIQKAWSCQQTVQVTFKKKIHPYTVKGIGNTQEEAQKQLQNKIVSGFSKDLYEF